MKKILITLGPDLMSEFVASELALHCLIQPVCQMHVVRVNMILSWLFKASVSQFG